MECYSEGGNQGYKLCGNMARPSRYLYISLTSFLPDTMELILGFVVVTVGLVATWRVQQSSRPVRVPLATTIRRSRRS